MATFYTVAKGPLISFGAIEFAEGASILEPGWGFSYSPDLSSPVNSPDEVDLAGLATMSMHGVYVWNYLVGRIGQTMQEAQDEITALITAAKTPNSDGSTGQVALLTVALAGYTSTNATGKARLIGVVANETGPTWDKLSLSFLIPQGLSYTA